MTTPRRKHFDYLNSLRLSGETNMFGAAPFLMREFDIGSKDALVILKDWMAKFPEPVVDEPEKPKSKKKEKKEKKPGPVASFFKRKK